MWFTFVQHCSNLLGHLGRDHRFVEMKNEKSNFQSTQKRQSPQGFFGWKKNTIRAEMCHYKVVAQFCGFMCVLCVQYEKKTYLVVVVEEEEEEVDDMDCTHTLSPPCTTIRSQVGTGFGPWDLNSIKVITFKDSLFSSSCLGCCTERG